MVDKLPLDEQLKVVTQQIVRAKIYFDLWWFLAGEDTNSQILDCLNRCPYFFRFDAHAHFVSMIVHSAVVWDKRKDTISLVGLGDEVLDPRRNQQHAAIKDSLTEAHKKARGIVKIRHGAIAHRSASDDYASVFKQTGVIPNELPKMMQDWLNLANQLRAIRCIPDEAFDRRPLEHLQKVIMLLGGPDLRPRYDTDLFSK